jgi:hypothetical protein
MLRNRTANGVLASGLTLQRSHKTAKKLGLFRAVEETIQRLWLDSLTYCSGCPQSFFKIIKNKTVPPCLAISIPLHITILLSHSMLNNKLYFI